MTTATQPLEVVMSPAPMVCGKLLLTAAYSCLLWLSTAKVLPPSPPFVVNPFDAFSSTFPSLGTGFHPPWGNFGDDSSGECGVPLFNRFKMPDNGNSLFWSLSCPTAQRLLALQLDRACCLHSAPP
jgi:hypothetical protein